MAHEIESMFFKGETPWHGLGNRVFDAISCEEALKQAGLDWQVKLQPIYLKDGVLLKGGKAVVRESDGKELGVVGPRYVPLQNEEAFKPFNAFVDAGLVTLETAGSLQDGKKIWVLARIGGGDMPIVGDDCVRKYILLSNSHDGTTAVRYGLTGVRVVCANTMAMAHNSKESHLIRVKHSNQTIANLESLRQTIDLANRQFAATAEQYKALAAKQISRKDLEKYVLVALGQPETADLSVGPKDPNGLSTRAKNRVEGVISLFESGRGMDLPGVKGTVWAAYNAVTQYLSHEAGNNAQNRYNSLWFGPGATVNADALAAAVKLAA